MRLDLAALLRDAWAMWQRDRGLLLPLAGMTLFLPSLATQLLLPRRILEAGAQGDAQDAQAATAATEAMVTALVPYLPLLVLVQLVSLWGGAVLWTVYLDRRRPTLLAALVPSIGLALRYLAAMLLVTLGGALTLAPVSALLSLILPAAVMGMLIVPIFYIYARLMLVGPALTGERPIGPIAALRRSWRLTSQSGWKLAWIVSSCWLLIVVVSMVSGTIEAALTAGDTPNPVIFAITASFASAGNAVGSLALGLIAIAAYRRLSSTGT